MSEQQQQVAIPQEAIDTARDGGPVGFMFFCLLVTGQSLPRHVLAWVEKLFVALVEHRDVVIEAFRGSTKTTSITQLFTAYLIGLNPLGTSLLIQAGDDSANENTAKIADIIKNNPGWKLIFPNVTPDEKQGWGAKGYEVKDDSLDYGAFRRLRTKDPTLLGLGYKSNEIVGKHPTLLLIADDIMTEETASSEVEQRKVVKTFSGSIMPTRMPNNPLTVVIGTPWNSSDVIAKAKATGEFLCLRTPLYEVAEGGTRDYLAKTGQFIHIAWPEKWTVEKIEHERKIDLTGGPEFDRMFLLVLGSGLKRELAYMSYPSYVVNPAWPTAGGCDPIGATDPSKSVQEHHHFALAYIAKLPTGGAVITGGVLEKCSHPEGLDYIRQAQTMFTGWLGCVLEGGGENEGFVQIVMLAPGLRVIPMKTGNKSKAERIVKGVGSWTRLGRVKISDARSPFLDALRAFAEEYPNVSQSHSGWDAWDSVYWALKLMPDVLTMPELDDDLGPKLRHRSNNPFNSLGSQTYN